MTMCCAVLRKKKSEQQWKSAVEQAQPPLQLTGLSASL